MATKKPVRQKVGAAAIEKGLTTLLGKLSSAAPKKRGSILLSLTDSGDDIYLDGIERKASVSRGAGAAPPVVRIAGPSSVLKAIMDGKKEASRAFVAGGIQVSGDLEYLEALLKDLGLLKCG